MGYLEMYIYLTLKFHHDMFRNDEAYNSYVKSCELQNKNKKNKESKRLIDKTDIVRQTIYVRPVITRQNE